MNPLQQFIFTTSHPSPTLQVLHSDSRLRLSLASFSTPLEPQGLTLQAFTLYYKRKVFSHICHRKRFYQNKRGLSKLLSPCVCHRLKVQVGITSQHVSRDVLLLSSSNSQACLKLYHCYGSEADTGTAPPEATQASP